MKIFQRVSELLGGHEIMTDGQTDRQIITKGPPETSSGGALIKSIIVKSLIIMKIRLSVL